MNSLDELIAEGVRLGYAAVNLYPHDGRFEVSGIGSHIADQFQVICEIENDQAEAILNELERRFPAEGVDGPESYRRTPLEWCGFDGQITITITKQ